MDTGNEIETEIFTTPQKDQKSIDSIIDTDLIDTAAVSLSNIATTDVESDVPIEISASSITNSRKPPPPANITLLSPSSHTRSRSLTTRKRTTPEKYVPSYNTSFKSRRSLETSASKAKRCKSKSTPESKTPGNEVEIVVDDDDSSVHEAVIVNDKAYILECQNEAVALRLVSDEDKCNVIKLKEAENSQRRYIKSMCDITKRSSSNISWAGWTHGYFQEIRLSEYARIYRETGKYVD
jgi:hypothetical protein